MTAKTTVLAEEMKQRFNTMLKELDQFDKQVAEQAKKNEKIWAESSGDEVDQLSFELDQTFQLKLKKRKNAYKHKILEALQKIESGTYGECIECGVQIAAERLLARPTADMCICCKEESEAVENQTFCSKNQTFIDGITTKNSQMVG